MKKKVIISLTLLLSPLVMAVALRTYDNYRFDLRLSAQLQERQLEQTIIQTLKDGNWQNSRKQYHRYNKEGKVTLTVYQVFKDGKWQNDQKMAYQYDSTSGFESERIWWRWKNDKWIENLRFKQERDVLGRITDEMIEEYKDDRWAIVRKNVTAYQGNSRLKHTQTYFNWKNEEWAKSWQDVYTFERSNLVLKKGYQWKNDQWAWTSSTHYSYNNSDLRVEESIKRVNAGVERDFRTTTNEYTNGIKSSSHVRVFRGGEWLDSEKHTHQYANL